MVATTILPRRAGGVVEGNRHEGFVDICCQAWEQGEAYSLLFLCFRGWQQE